MCAVDPTLLSKTGYKFAFELSQWGKKRGNEGRIII